MKTLTAALSLAALGTGVAGAALAYASTAPGSTSVPAISSPAPSPEAAVVPQPRAKVKVHFRKCRSGARLEHGRCVRHVVRTVVVPAPVEAAVSTTSTSSRASGEADDRPRQGRSDRPDKIRHEADDHAGEGSEHEGGVESEGAADHGSVDAPESDD